MVQTLTKETNHLFPLSLQNAVLERILGMEEVMAQLNANKRGSHTCGCMIFRDIELADGRIMNVLVEYDLINMLPIVDGGIIGVMISDEEMPDEFLDKYNTWRELIKKSKQQ